MHILWRGSLSQRIRLVSGLLLFVFAAAHFFNHALGLVSLDAMVGFDAWRTWIIRSPPGTVVFAAALIAHAGLALKKLAGRRTFNLPPWELCQIGLGLAIPLLLLPHIVGTRVASSRFGVNTSYPYELLRIWDAAMLQQSTLLLVVWLHGCLGLHHWLRLVRGYGRAAPLLLSLAVLLPFAALSGVIVQARLLTAAMADPRNLAALKAASAWPTPAMEAKMAELGYALPGIFLSIATAAVLFAVGRSVWRGRTKRIRVQYVAGPLVRTNRGPTVLELSRRHGIPHASVCGGRGRCSTCRILVLSGESGLQPAGEAERRTLQSIGAPANVRLACQARPLGEMTILPLLKAGTSRRFGMSEPDLGFAGTERDFAVLFVDIRGFTALSEKKLPFDVVFLLNEFFAAAGRPIYELGGWINDYAGDGLLALFSDGGMAAACRSALLAAAEIDRALAMLNRRLSDEIAMPLRIAMGLHAGPHVLGRLGYGETQRATIVGAAVNVASRLEALAKAFDMQIALSELAAAHAGLDTRQLRVEETEIRGLGAPMRVVLAESARALPAFLAPQIDSGYVKRGTARQDDGCGCPPFHLEGRALNKRSN